jgi:hypothetical protein
VPLCNTFPHYRESNRIRGMNLIPMRVFGVALVTALLTASCGSGQGEFPEPPDSFERLGLGPRLDPIQWIRTTGDRGDRILYYADVVDYYGEQREVSVSGALTITENSATQEKSYHWREVHRKFDPKNKSYTTIKTDEGSGTVTTEPATTATYGPVTVYRLNGTKPAEKFRTWVTFGRELVVPAPTIEESGPLGTSVMWHARATPHVLEVTQFADELQGYKLGLKRDDVLIIRLQRGLKYRAAVLKDGTQGTQLMLTNTTTEPAFEEGETIDVYHFTAKAPGWADVQFDKATVGTFRVRVE